MKIKKLIPSILLAASLCSASYASLCDLTSRGKAYIGPTLLVQQISANDSRFRGLHPRMSLGLADVSRNYYFAAEIFATPATLSLSDVRYNGGSSAKSSTSFGFSLIPGVRLYQQIFGYARLGIISSKFSSPNSSKAGAQMGLGLQSKLAAQWALRGEYIHTIYGSVSRIGTPNSNELGVGFIYIFDQY